MLLKRILYYFSFLHLVDSQLQINLYLTDWPSDNNNLQHDCLYVPAYMKNESFPHQIISYCMSELSSKFKIKKTNIDQILTFDQLSKQNITNEQLYLWSAPIDLIEQYQFYLNKLKNSEKTSLGNEIYYNCTLPYFGLKCEYTFNDYKSYHLSLNEIIYDYYYYNRYEPTLFTCYIHLECNRGPYPSCLDWTEICDGTIDCIDNGLDEQYCWKLEIHQCNQNEFQCSNGQCIPQSFFYDDIYIPDCLDQSDEYMRYDIDLYKNQYFPIEPTFQFEDILCRKLIYGKHPDNTFLTSSCVQYRSNLLAQTMISIKPNSISDECWTAMKCFMKMPVFQDNVCGNLCSDKICDKIIQKTCPDIIYLPAFPILYGDIYLGYNKNKFIYSSLSPEPRYICYNAQLLHMPNDNKTFLLSNNTCRFYTDSYIYSVSRSRTFIETYVFNLFRWLQSNTLSVSNHSTFYDTSMMYKCINSSKYITNNRLFDGFNDCYYKDDEYMPLFNKTCSIIQNVNYFKCKTTNECIPKRFIQDGICHCTIFNGYCDDERADVSYVKNTISFQIICNKRIDLSLPKIIGISNEILLPHIIEDSNETDETNCEHWPLIHIYNRCDGFWDILNGSDEINCDLSPLINCSANHHICISPKTNQLMCLSIEKANDGIVDCLGAADEPTLCRKYLFSNYPQSFYCNKIKYFPCIEAREICDNSQICDNNEDEQVCKTGDLPAVSVLNGICTKNYESDGSDVAKVLCRHFLISGPGSIIHFKLNQTRNSIKENIKDEKSEILLYQSVNQTIELYQPRCHRGLNLKVWLDKKQNLTRNICFCPPNYYGKICEYQNERISLTLQFRVTSDSVKIPFIIIILLIDNTNERIIHSYEQFIYLSIKHCQKKFNIYLLYSTKPKDKLKEYLIHIDIYEKIKLNYRGSIIKSFNYSFLPVHRLVYQLDIPRISNHYLNNNECINGKSIQYFNDPINRTFCQCTKGWFGKYCTIKYNCNCSSDSLCLGKLSNNRSLCICPINKIGLRCLIDNNICQKNKNPICLNNGSCIIIDEYGISTKKFVCICRQGYFGDRCEIVPTKLIISFDKNIVLSSSIFIHFIEVTGNSAPIRTTTFKRILFEQNSISIYWSLPFHLVFVELSNKTYYLILMQKIYQQGIIIKETLNVSNRCLHIIELSNETFANSSFLHRIKSYHLLCQINSSKLSCFYDERQLCLCQQVDQQHVANCFQFDHNMNLNCFGQSGCLNGGQCYQEDTICPRISICVCPICYFGSQCQFNTNGYSLSLDVILGYHIRPNENISQQSFAVLISLILTLIITILGFGNGILSLITFKNETTHQSGCGIYLLTSSIITLLTMIIFLVKFLIFLFSQMGSIKNKLFLIIQCHSIDFLLRSCLTMDQWLTTFVAIERAFIIIKGIKFNQKKSKLIAKWTILSLILFTILTNIPDPINRRIVEENDDENDDEEKRIWCIVDYSSVIRILNLTITIVHFIFPFIINVISAIIIIIVSTRQRSALQKQEKYKKALHEQIKQHKNLLIGPCVLIILGIPRLIISFASGCMKSSSDSWLFLLGYFISLIPPLLTFILFVLPSTTYKQAFKKAINHYRNIIRRRP